MRRAFVLAGVGVLALACVPRGDPPSGRQVLADRISLPLAILPSAGDGVTRILFARPGEGDGSMDLHVLSVDAAGNAPVEHLLAAGVVADPYGGCQFGAAGCLQTDARGRLLLFSGTAFSGTGTSLARIDPVTGDRMELGAVSGYKLSPSGQRLLVYPRAQDAPSTLFEADDRAVPLDTNGGQFGGEVLYYVTKQREATRLAPGGTPEVLATGVDGVSPLAVDGDPLVMLIRATADRYVSNYALLDTATLQETPLAVNTSAIDLSRDGRWLVTSDIVTGAITFTDWRSGAQDVFRPPSWVPVYGYQWRPGHVEMWFPNGPGGPATTWIKQPGLAPVEIPGVGAMPLFTGDGAYWFSLKGVTYNEGIMIGAAENPTGPRFEVTAAGTQIGGSWQTPDGRIVVSAWTETPELSNVYVVDPNTGDRQVMGEQGAVLAVGRTRLLVNQRLVHQAGDLTVFDLGTGHPTVLAAEFALAAVVEAQGADQVAPGAAVAFKFQARFPSPYDGVWLATVP